MSAEELGCAYWANIAGFPTSNTETVTGESETDSISKASGT